MTTREEILTQFRADMWNAYFEPLRSRYHYNATDYCRRLEDFGPEGTAIMLIDGDEITYGLNKLAEIGMLHWSVEAIILKPEYRIPDFAPTTRQRREKARQRLWERFRYRDDRDPGE